MTWPEEIVVSGVPIRITRVTQAHLEEIVGEIGVDGTIDLIKLEVLYSEDLNGPYKDVIVYHEIFHILEYILFAGHTDLDEHVIQAFALASREITEQLMNIYENCT